MTIGLIVILCGLLLIYEILREKKCADNAESRERRRQYHDAYFVKHPEAQHSYAYPIGFSGPYSSGRHGGMGDGTAVTQRLARGGLRRWVG